MIHVFTQLARPSQTTDLVTLRLIVGEDEGVRCIHVAGRLTGEEVGELTLAIEGGCGTVCLDLGNLRSADADGLAALRRLRRAGIEMRGVPPHLAWRIEEDES